MRLQICYRQTSGSNMSQPTDDKPPLKGVRSPSRDLFSFGDSMLSLGRTKLGTSNDVQINHSKFSSWHDRIPIKVWSMQIIESCDALKCSKISDNISQTVRNRYVVNYNGTLVGSHL